jgi:hypothetical protein
MVFHDGRTQFDVFILLGFSDFKTDCSLGSVGCNIVNSDNCELHRLAAFCPDVLVSVSPMLNAAGSQETHTHSGPKVLNELETLVTPDTLCRTSVHIQRVVGISPWGQDEGNGLEPTVRMRATAHRRGPTPA